MERVEIRPKMRNQIGIVVDVGQTCVRCKKYRGEGVPRGFFCMEYERQMDSVKYICKNFVDRE